MTDPNSTNPDKADDYQFTNEWFGYVRPIWSNLIPQINPTKILEIGSFEGASTCFLIDTLSPLKPIEIHCIDTWEGGIEHESTNTDLSSVEARFIHNTNKATQSSKNKIDLEIHKGYSDVQLAKLLANQKQGYFDFIYVDGSHQAPDVLCDAILSFRLLRVGGFIAFDDYLWAENLPYGIDPIRCPKIAIDAFTNVYCRKLRIIEAQLYQLYIQKVSD